MRKDFSFGQLANRYLAIRVCRYIIFNDKEEVTQATPLLGIEDNVPSTILT